MDKKLLTNVFLKYHAVLVAAARCHTIDGHQAQDAVSETYTRLLENWDLFPKLESETDCIKLARTILRNVICDDYRKTDRAKKFAESERTSSTKDDESNTCASDASFLVGKIVGKVELTPMESKILPLVIKGYPNRKIAEVLGVAPEEVSKPRFTMLRKLRKVVQRNQNRDF